MTAGAFARGMAERVGAHSAHPPTGSALVGDCIAPTTPASLDRSAILIDPRLPETPVWFADGRPDDYDELEPHIARFAGEVLVSVPLRSPYEELSRRRKRARGFPRRCSRHGADNPGRWLPPPGGVTHVIRAAVLIRWSSPHLTDAARRCSSMAELLLPKQIARVRFPSSALRESADQQPFPCDWADRGFRPRRSRDSRRQDSSRGHLVVTNSRRASASGPSTTPILRTHRRAFAHRAPTGLRTFDPRTTTEP